MKRFALRLLALSGLAAGAAPAAAQAIYCVSGLSDAGPDNFLVMRYSPSMQSPWRQDANLRNGDRVEVLGESGAFYRVRFQNRYEGWSARRYLAPCRVERRAQPPSQAIPAAFHGVWAINSGGEGQCRRSDWDNNRGDNLMSITPRDIQYYESSCAPKTARDVAATSFQATMSCAGEGMTWDTIDHYSIHTVAGRRQLVIVNIRRTASRDESGKVYPDQDLDKVVTSIATECR